MKIILEPGKSKNILATIAIGDEYYNSWKRYASSGWIKYCEVNNLGLVVFDEELLSRDDEFWKKATWQKMLMGETLKNSKLEVENVCFLYSDILINHKSPNVFDDYNSETIALVSQMNNMPYVPEEAKRRLAFLRHTHYDNKYPLDSALFMSLKQIFEHHNVPVQPDYGCMGFFVFNVKNHSSVMKSWFQKYDRNVDSMTGGGDEPHINYEMQNWGKISWLDYKFQALWTYEIAIKYPFLYSFGRDNELLIRECIEASLYSNYFLHFAGSWHESNMWKIEGIFSGEKMNAELEKYYKYLDTPVTGIPKGQIKP
jgi:hypothetical protein